MMAPPVDVVLGDRPPIVRLLERHRERLGLSRRDFARHIGTDPTTYSLVISGKRACGFAFLGRVLSNSPEVMDDPEAREVVWYTKKEESNA